MSSAQLWKVAVIGASGNLGSRIVDQLLDETDIRIVATSRDLSSLSDYADLERVECRELDLEKPERAANTLLDCETVVFCPILTLSADAAKSMRKQSSGARLILFSSNNVGLDEEAPIYEQLRKREDEIRKLTQAWVMIRPTMIYGAENDGNLGRLMRLARRSPVMPLIGSGYARQQPIHYADLADLVVQLIVDVDWFQSEIGAAGPDNLSLAELYRKVLKAGKSNSWLWRVSATHLLEVFSILKRLGLKPPLSEAQLHRIDMDKLPTWPKYLNWSPGVTIEDGLADLAEQIGVK